LGTTKAADEVAEYVFAGLFTSVGVNEG
jgi:hypothetical protein